MYGRNAGESTGSSTEVQRIHGNRACCFVLSQYMHVGQCDNVRVASLWANLSFQHRVTVPQQLFVLHTPTLVFVQRQTAKSTFSAKCDQKIQVSEYIQPSQTMIFDRFLEVEQLEICAGSFRTVLSSPGVL